MNHEQVRELEDEIEYAIADALKQVGKRHGLKQPHNRTCQPMSTPDSEPVDPNQLRPGPVGIFVTSSTKPPSLDAEPTQSLAES